ncbi:MAG: hypothetical protein ACYCW6_09910 [Candidatus Xenobia bacterium]
MRRLALLCLLLSALAVAALPRLLFTHCEIIQVAAGERRGYNVPTVRVVLQNRGAAAVGKLTLRLMQGDDEVSEFGPVEVPARSKAFFTWQLSPGDRENMRQFSGRRYVDVMQGDRELASGDLDLRDPDYLKSQGIHPSPAAEPTSPPGF